MSGIASMFGMAYPASASPSPIDTIKQELCMQVRIYSKSITQHASYKPIKTGHSDSLQERLEAYAQVEKNGAGTDIGVSLAKEILADKVEPDNRQVRVTKLSIQMVYDNYIKLKAAADEKKAKGPAAKKCLCGLCASAQAAPKDTEQKADSSDSEYEDAADVPELEDESLPAH